MQKIAEMSVADFTKLQAEKSPYVLIDVREAHEFATANMNGKLMPLSTWTTDLEKITAEIPKDRPVIIHCMAGGRSRQAIALLQAQGTYDNLYNLTGGFSAWQNFDKSRHSL